MTFFPRSSKVMRNCSKKLSRPSKLNAALNPAEKTMTASNETLSIVKLTECLYPRICPPIPTRSIDLPASSAMPRYSAIPAGNTEKFAPESSRPSVWKMRSWWDSVMGTMGKRCCRRRLYGNSIIARKDLRPYSASSRREAPRRFAGRPAPLPRQQNHLMRLPDLSIRQSTGRYTDIIRPGVRRSKSILLLAYLRSPQNRLYMSIDIFALQFKKEMPIFGASPIQPERPHATT